MFIILVYDVNEKRVAKALKTCRRYLFWVQNSVFEGEITEACLMRLKRDLLKVIHEEEDSVIIYTFESKDYTSVQILGCRKGGPSTVI